MSFFHSKGCLVRFGYFNSKETNARYLKSYIKILDSQEMNAKHYEKKTQGKMLWKYKGSKRIVIQRIKYLVFE